MQRENGVYQIFAVATERTGLPYNGVVMYECADADGAAYRCIDLLRKGHSLQKVEGPNGFIVQGREIEQAFLAGSHKGQPSAG